MPGNSNLHDSSRNKQDEFYTNLLLIEDEQKPYRAHFKGKRVLSNYGYTLTTPNGATLTRTVTRDPYRRSLTLDCTTRFNSVEVSSFACTFDAHSRPVARNNDRFAYNDRDEVIGAAIGTNRLELLEPPSVAIPRLKKSHPWVDLFRIYVIMSSF